MKYYFEGAEILAPLSIVSNEPIYEVDTVSLSKQRASQDVQRWELSFNTIGTPETQQQMMISAITGIISTNTMIMPQLPEVDRLFTVTANTATVSVPALAGATQVIISGAGKTGFLPKGSFISFSNNDKIYMTTTDADFTSGDATVRFFPKLQSPLTTSHSLEMSSSVQLVYYRDISNLTGITFSDGVLSNAGTITVIEAL